MKASEIDRLLAIKTITNAKCDNDSITHIEANVPWVFALSIVFNLIGKIVFPARMEEEYESL